jgi:hypothetical protein
MKPHRILIVTLSRRHLSPESPAWRSLRSLVAAGIRRNRRVPRKHQLGRAASGRIPGVDFRITGRNRRYRR